MILPTSTYRLQLREGVDLHRAAELVPYLAELGVSHLYLSPIFTAASGSTHGYDVTDANEVDPILGGRPALDALSRQLKDHGLGLIIDIVPNHMAFSVENVWLRDVLTHGQDSRWAGHFDINWQDGALPLPWLEAPFAELSERGEIAIDGREMVVGDLRVPLNPLTDASDPDTAHHQQVWRLTHWRTEASGIRHRRFFTVTGLIGLKVEAKDVFEDIHRLTFDLVDADVVQGLRIDHVDGLADPGEYLDRLRNRLPETPVWIEKILTGDEPLQDWPVQGSTGYVAARSIARVLTDADGAARLAADAPEFKEMVDAAKVQIVTQELPAELDRLTDLALAAAASDHVAREWGRNAWRDAILHYLAAFPRYRTYTTATTVPDDDAALIREVIDQAAEGRPDPGALNHLGGLLCDPGQAPLRLRMQQMTGAVIAKAQEDTGFYRHVALISANEVGGEPEEPAMDVAAFHANMERRQSMMPGALTLTSSHDTKRSEDARMRIAAISHDPDTRTDLMALTDLKAPWGWYLAQSAFAAEPVGDLVDRLPAHMEKAMREAKEDTFWTAQNETFETRITDAAREIAGRIHPLPGDLSALARRGEALALAQCALKLTIPGIPDIYQGTEVGSFLLTDPDNRRAVDFDALATALHDTTGLTSFDRAKLSLTRMLLTLRRDRPEICTAPYEPLEAPAGELSFRRGPMSVRISVTGTDLSPGDGTAFWPSGDIGPGPVEIMLAD